jgi:tRNA (cytidine/uridine-2'-O-)-methyltransferase
MFDIVLYQPEIPPNTGNTMRLAAVTGCRLHLIEPLGFEMDDARLRRAGMDYRDRAVVTIHPDVETWVQTARHRVFALTVDGEAGYDEIDYQADDALLFGPESVGLPEHIKTAPWVTGRLRLPMVPDVRSMNLANAVAVVVYEAWRQNSFSGASMRGRRST